MTETWTLPPTTMGTDKRAVTEQGLVAAVANWSHTVRPRLLHLGSVQSDIRYLRFGHD